LCYNTNTKEITYSTGGGGWNVSGTYIYNNPLSNNVGIGTSNPQYALDVSGTIQTNNLILSSNPNIVTTGSVIFSGNNCLFITSGSITLTSTYICNYIIVGGGGGGVSGSTNGGSGGGGGGFSTGQMTLSSGTYSITVGSGGASNTAGGNSIFNGVTSGGGQTDKTGGTGNTQGGSGGSGSSGNGTSGTNSPSSFSFNGYTIYVGSGGGGGGGSSGTGGSGGTFYGGSGGSGGVRGNDATVTNYGYGNGGGGGGAGGGAGGSGSNGVILLMFTTTINTNSTILQTNSTILGYKSSNGKIAIGYYAQNSTQATNSIVLNASSTILNTSTRGLYVAPIRNDTNITNQLCYNTNTNEITYFIPYTPVSSTTGSPTITYDSSNGIVYYVFVKSGSITLSTACQCNYIIVGGGGNGGSVVIDTSYGAGGGGGGQILTGISSLSNTITPYSVNVGTSNNSSSFNGITAIAGSNGSNPSITVGGAGGVGGSGTGASGGTGFLYDSVDTTTAQGKGNNSITFNNTTIYVGNGGGGGGGCYGGTNAGNGARGHKVGLIMNGSAAENGGGYGNGGGGGLYNINNGNGGNGSGGIIILQFSNITNNNTTNVINGNTIFNGNAIFNGTVTTTNNINKTILYSSPIKSSNISSNAQYNLFSPISLNPGIWLLNMSFFLTVNNMNNLEVHCNAHKIYYITAPSPNINGYYQYPITYLVNPTITTTYTISITVAFSSGSCTINNDRSVNDNCYLQCVQL
jgi:hypothetical protein